MAITAIDRAAIATEKRLQRELREKATEEARQGEYVERLVASGEFIGGAAAGGLIDAFSDEGEAHKCLALGKVRIPIVPTLAAIGGVLGVMNVFGDTISPHLLYPSAGFAGSAVSSFVRKTVETARKQ
jgi:hypothetical protein